MQEPVELIEYICPDDTVPLNRFQLAVEPVSKSKLGGIKVCAFGTKVITGNKCRAKKSVF
jgi:hypothetical protein